MKSCLALFCAIALVSCFSVQAEVRDEFHQNYPLGENGKISLENVNGQIEIIAWDKNEVKLDAIKKARQKEHLDEVSIQIEQKPDRLKIWTQYPRRKSGWFFQNNNSTSVDYTLMVPRSARLEKIANVNGSVLIEAVQGQVNASTVNGQIKTRNLGGNGKLETVNGSVDASFTTLKEVTKIELETVNGGARLGLPRLTNARVDAETVNGSIRSEHEFQARKNGHVGKELHAVMGDGLTHIKATTVNGSIRFDKLPASNEPVEKP